MQLKSLGVSTTKLETSGKTQANGKSVKCRDNSDIACESLCPPWFSQHCSMCMPCH